MRQLGYGVLLSLCLTCPALAQEHGVGARCAMRDILGHVDDAWGLDIAVDERLAVLARGRSGIQILDVQNPAQMTSLSLLDGLGSVQDVALSGDTAFAAVGSALGVVDLSDPSQPTLVIFEPVQAVGVEARGSLVYAATAEGLRIYDASASGDLAELSLLALTNSRKVALDGDRAFVSADPGMVIVDVRDPVNPVALGSVAISAAGTSLDAADGIAAAVSAGGRVTIVDARDPSSPRIVSTIEPVRWANAVAMMSGRLAVQLDDATVQVYDMEDPTTPALIGSYERLGLGDAIALRASDGTALFSRSGPLCCDQQVIAVDTRQPKMTAITKVAGDASSVGARGTLGVVGGQEVRFLDIGDPRAPRLLGVFDSEERIKDPLFFGDAVTLYDRDGRLYVLDIHDPSAPTLLTSLAVPGVVPRDSVRVGEYAYLVDSFELAAVDMHDPASPIIGGIVDAPSRAEMIAGTDGLLCVGEAPGEIHLYTLDDPALPSLVWSSSEGLWVTGISFDGDRLYVVDGLDEQVLIYDVTDPQDPQQIGSYSPFLPPWNVRAGGGLVALASGSDFGQIELLDLRDVESPTIVASFSPHAFIWGLDFEGDAMLVQADSDACVIDLRECACPADLDGDGDGDSDDFFLFLDAFRAGDAGVCDVDRDGDCDSEDFFLYIERFFQPCV